MKNPTVLSGSNITKSLMLAEKASLAVLIIGLFFYYDSGTHLLAVQIPLGILAVIYFAMAYTSNSFVDINIDDLDNEEDIDDFTDEEIEQLPETRFLFSSHILPRVLLLATGISVAGYLALLTFPENDAYRKLIFVGGGTILVGLSVLAYELLKGFKDIKLLQPILFRAVPVALFDLYLLFSLLK